MHIIMKLYLERNWCLEVKQKHIKVLCVVADIISNPDKNLGLRFNAKKTYSNAKYCFINITHPSARIGADKLFEEMNMEEVFGARLKRKSRLLWINLLTIKFLFERIKLHEKLCDIRYPWMLQGLRHF